ncbi:hypothetical protein NQ317_005978 [Molorchus minor]|uniref:Uncharacterized protein n=1 Tax=Molorchus minor TaxID=1323400 RepID=A0ABQ9IWF5_9CUCU|nr:hypothetical protein NQ317_005978 [Molorchus minor]
MDYDDPLGSDDSFFEEPKALNKRGNSPKEREKTVENLFNITDIKTGEETIKNVAQTLKRKTQKKNEDWLFGDSDTLEKKTKKTDFLEDILSVRPSSSSKNKVTSFDDILKGSKFTASSKSSDKLKDTPAATEKGENLEGDLQQLWRMRWVYFSNEYQSGDYYTKDKKETPAADFQTKTNRISDKGVPDWLGGSTVTPHIEIAKENERDAKDFLEIGHNRNPPEEEQEIKKFGWCENN